MSGVRLLENWSPPEGAGAAVACLATTFTFDADFFSQECVARFLSLSSASVLGEGDDISTRAAIFEEEDALSEAQVSVLVDRSTPAEKRNLRWDLLPVAVPGGLLHAKIAVLLWERSARLIIGSPNLTPAGYRRQVELALAIDLDAQCQVPKPVIDDFVSEVRRLIDLVPGPSTGPKARAQATVNRLEKWIQALNLPANQLRNLRLSIAPARPGLSPLERLEDVWHGPRPLSATMLSPFWDDNVPAPAIEAVRRHMTGRPIQHRRLTLIAAIDPYSGAVHAPTALASEDGADVVAFDPPDQELRALHAKLLLIESIEWTAALIGSSNATEAGFGLHPHRGHHELNVWIGCPSGSAAAKHLRGLARQGAQLDIDDDRWETATDEDEVQVPILPLGFVSCLVQPAHPAQVVLELDTRHLPVDWIVRTPNGELVLDSAGWTLLGNPLTVSVDVDDDALPAFLLVTWRDGDDEGTASWTANVDDRSALPPPAELASLSAAELLAVLASTRPLPVALEQELRRRELVGRREDAIETDPLRSFDDSGLLFQRVRRLSFALWRLQERLSRPLQSLDALHWRLNGTIGPLAIANGLAGAANDDQTLPGEPQFLLAELALTVGTVDWSLVAGGLDQRCVRSLVEDVLTAIENHQRELPPSPDPALDQYVHDAFQAARS